MSDIKLTEAQAKDRIEEVMQILKVRQMCMDDPTHEDVVDYRERYRALQMAVEALDKRETYRWHDMRKDPQDYPTKGGYLLVRVLVKNLGIETYGVASCWADCERDKDIFDVIEWRYIEPSEADKRYITKNYAEGGS